jgi:hypothetical protein
LTKKKSAKKKGTKKKAAKKKTAVTKKRRKVAAQKKSKPMAKSQPIAEKQPAGNEIPKPPPESFTHKVEHKVEDLFSAIGDTLTDAERLHHKLDPDVSREPE